MVVPLPSTLSADPRNNAHSATFKTAAGKFPIAKMTLGRRGQNEFTFRLEVSQATILTPSLCPANPENLTMSFTIDDKVNPPVVVTSVQPWRCSKRGDKFEYLRTP